MKKIITLVLIAALTVLSCFAFTSCGEKKDSEYIKEQGKIIIGITDFAPMDYQDNDGNWIGFDAEMATLFAQSLGVNVEFMEIEWDNKVLELNSKNIDCVWNGMTLGDEVKAAMECSQPYCNNAQIVIVKANVADQYQTVDSCKTLNFAVEGGSAGKDMAIENNFNYIEVESQAAALMEVSAGTADAAIIDSLMAAAMVGTGTSYENLAYTVALNSEFYGVGFRKGSDLAAKLDAFFAQCKVDGTLNQIATKYGIQASLIND